MDGYLKWIREKVGKEKVILVSADAIIVNDDGNIFVQKRTDFENAWCFPGGYLELDESVTVGLIREVKEETGLDVAVEKLIGVYSGERYVFQYPNGDVISPVSFAFRCRVTGGELRVDKHESHESIGGHFVSPDMVPSLTFKNDQDAFEDYLAGRFGVIK
jgi:ADP-ribose pyrophosphatase YjhB (NUDIX family)